MPDEAASEAGARGSAARAERNAASCRALSGCAGSSAQARWLITARRLRPASICGAAPRRATSAGASPSRAMPVSMWRMAGSARVSAAPRRRQFSAMAARSMSSTPPARAGGGGLERAIGEVVAAHEIVEPGGLAVEAQRHLADRPVALLGDEHFTGAAHFGQPLVPMFVALVELVVALLGPPHWLAAAQIVFLAEDEHDHVGVLLDRAGFAQVGELRALVVAVLDGTRELRQRQHGNIELLGERLQAAGDLRDLLHAILGAAAL